MLKRFLILGCTLSLTIGSVLGQVVPTTPPVPMPMPMTGSSPLPMPKAQPGFAPSLTQSLPGGIQAADPMLTQSLPAYTQPELPGFSSVGAPDPMFWVRAEYLFSWMSATKLPILATTSPTGTPIAQAGIPSQGGTIPILDGYVNDRYRNGFKLNIGSWFEGYRQIGMDIGFSMIEGQSHVFLASSDQTPIIGRPFFNRDNGLPQAILVAFPGTSLGNLNIRATSGYLLDGYADLIERGIDTGRFKVNALLGYRYFQYTDTLNIVQTIYPQSAPFVAGTSIVATDLFQVRNNFHGAEVGLRAELNGDAMSMEFLAKVAYGRLASTVRIEGSTTTQVPGAVTKQDDGGAFALISNIGSRNIYNAAVLPEFGTKIKWRLYDTVQLHVGYTILMLQGIGKAPDLIDNEINASNFPPVTTVGPRPIPQFERTNLWIQSVTLGITMRY